MDVQLQLGLQQLQLGSCGSTVCTKKQKPSDSLEGRNINGVPDWVTRLDIVMTHIIQSVQAHPQERCERCWMA